MAAQSQSQPAWELPPANFLNSYPYYATVGGQTNTLLYGQSPVPMDVNGDGLLDFIYKFGQTSFVELNNGAGWDRVYNCYYTDGAWHDDCAYLNSAGAAAPRAADDSGADDGVADDQSDGVCRYDAGTWLGDCQFIPE